MIFAIIILLLFLLFGLFLYSVSGGKIQILKTEPSYYDEFSAKNIYKRTDKIKEFFNLDSIKDFITNIQEPVDTIKTLDEISERLPYKSTWFLTPRREHIGQLKLFITELQFLTQVLESKQDEAVIIYAGSAPSNKLPFFENLFPNISWILIDPNEHVLMFPDSKTQYDEPYAESVVYGKAGKGEGKVYSMQSKEKQDKSEVDNYFFDAFHECPDEFIDYYNKNKRKYFIIEDFMSDGLATIFNKLVLDLKEKKISCFFISDIRTSSEFGVPTDLDILWNSAQQANWCRIMRPEKSMLKFRTPFWETANSVKYESSKPIYSGVLKKCKDFIDFISDYNKGKFFYFPNDAINIQAFAGHESVETRLITSDYDNKIEYDFHEFEEKLFYYNRIYCDLFIQRNHEKYWDKEIGIDGCGDCGIMCYVFKYYFEKYGLADDTKKSIKSLMHQIRRKFDEKSSFHGFFYESYANKDAIIKMQLDMINLVIYREISGKLKPVKITCKIFILRKKIFTDFMALISNESSDDTSKKYRDILKHAAIMIVYFPNMQFLSIISHMVVSRGYDSDVFKACMKIFKSINYNVENMDLVSKTEWNAYDNNLIKYFNTRFIGQTKHVFTYRGVYYNPNNMEKYCNKNSIENIYCITGAFYKHKIEKSCKNYNTGLYFPEMYSALNGFDVLCDYNKLVKENSLIIVNIQANIAVITYKIYNKIIDLINSEKYKNLKVLCWLQNINESNTFMSSVPVFCLYKEVIANLILEKDGDEESSPSNSIYFYTHGIDRSDVINLVDKLIDK